MIRKFNLLNFVPFHKDTVNIYSCGPTVYNYFHLGNARPFIIFDTLRTINESEIFNLAAGVCYEGYNGIICSPLVLGKIPQKIKDAVMCAYDALNYASEKMKPGTPCDVVLNAYTEYLTKYGYIDYCPY